MCALCWPLWPVTASRTTAGGDREAHKGKAPIAYIILGTYAHGHATAGSPAVVSLKPREGVALLRSQVSPLSHRPPLLLFWGWKRFLLSSFLLTRAGSPGLSHSVRDLGASAASRGLPRGNTCEATSSITTAGTRQRPVQAGGYQEKPVATLRRQTSLAAREIRLRATVCVPVCAK
jgi:hypothetical protein